MCISGVPRGKRARASLPFPQARCHWSDLVFRRYQHRVGSVATGAFGGNTISVDGGRLVLHCLDRNIDVTVYRRRLADRVQCWFRIVTSYVFQPIAGKVSRQTFLDVPQRTMGISYAAGAFVEARSSFLTQIRVPRRLFIVRRAGVKTPTLGGRSIGNQAEVAPADLST